MARTECGDESSNQVESPATDDNGGPGSSSESSMVDTENADPVVLRRSQRQKPTKIFAPRPNNPNLDDADNNNIQAVDEEEDGPEEEDEEDTAAAIGLESDSDSTPQGTSKDRRRQRKKKIVESEKRTVSRPTHCRKCNIKFTDAEAYRVHFKQMHSKLKRAPDDDVPDDFVREMLQKKMERKMIKQAQSNAVGIRDYCRKCGKEFDDDNLVVIHLRIDHFESEYGKEIYRNTWKKRITRHVKRDADQNKHLFQFVCDVCEHRFKTVDTLSSHRKNKHDLETVVDGKVIPPDNEMVCDECGKLCQSRNALANHKSNVHRKLKPYPCDFCEMSFVTKPLLLLHRRSKHLKDQAKIITCEVCGLTFTNMKFLTKHKRTHTDFRFKCQHCPRSFRSVSALQGHTDKNHLKVMRHECRFCGRKFWNTANKAKHVKQKHSDGVVHEDLIANNREKDWTVAGSKVDKVSIEEGLRPDEMPANAVVVDRSKRKLDKLEQWAAIMAEPAVRAVNNDTVPLPENIFDPGNNEVVIDTDGSSALLVSTSGSPYRRKRTSDQTSGLVQQVTSSSTDPLPYQLTSHNVDPETFQSNEGVIQQQSSPLIHSYQISLGMQPSGTFSSSNFSGDLVNSSSGGGSGGPNSRQRLLQQSEQEAAVHVISNASISIHSSQVSGICNFCDAYYPDLKSHGITGHMIPGDKIWSIYLSKSCTLSLDTSVIQTPAIQMN